ncbi:hypothetical protein HY490_02140 [Candidatus Woesearchaeota archaeon]|nr:hypothetical protein [Candidatus Woesearchaeota archaeon]
MAKTTVREPTGDLHYKLHWKAWAATIGLIGGIDMFLHVLIPTFGFELLWWNNIMYQLISTFFPLSMTIGGAFLALGMGALCGAVCGWLFATVHNKMLEWFN